ncbi:MAG: radical SAM family heme chaperone HemW [Lachnospiraceae bacterium]|nr:radical SAM family heme chaperone HemW [Lachnospiraceae bacterium]
MEKKLSIYIHIPFCVRKCLYCDFLSAPADDDTIKRYVNALVNEIRQTADTKEGGRVLSTVFFGGGTPSLLSADDSAAILSALSDTFDMKNVSEITMEMNPGTAQKDKCSELCKLGVSRFSLGLQSADDKELQRIGRIHRYADFLNTYEWLREAGCRNINVDMMSALPGQNMEGYVDGLHKITALRPEHISSYSLILEEGTPLNDMYEGKVPFPGEGPEAYRLPGEEEDARMYEMTGEVLGKAGYNRYEISNYSLPGFECRHNTVYWERGDYLGFGIGAASCVSNVRWKNSSSLHNYMTAANILADIREDHEILSTEEQMKETMFLGLRMMKGISKKRFEDDFGCGMSSVYAKLIAKYIGLGLLAENEERLFLTDRGILLSNQIFAEL